MNETPHLAETSRPIDAISADPELNSQNEVLTLPELTAHFNSLDDDSLQVEFTQYMRDVANASAESGADEDELVRDLNWSYSCFHSVGLTPVKLDNDPATAKQIDEIVKPTFMARVDFIAAFDAAKNAVLDTVEQSQIMIEASSATILEEKLSYGDVLGDPEQALQAVEFNLASESANVYARALAREVYAGKGDQIEQIAHVARYKYDEIMNHLPVDQKKDLTPFSGSESWIYWDLGKQIAMKDTVADEDYRHIQGDPLEVDERGRTTKQADIMLNSIVRRHVGWEIHNLWQKNSEISWLSDMCPDAISLMDTELKDNGQLPSWVLTEIGKIIETAAPYIDLVQDKSAA